MPSHWTREQRVAWVTANPDKVKAAQDRNNRSPKAKVRKARYHAKNPHARRADHIKRNYGITLAQESALVEAHQGLCAVCDMSLSEGYRNQCIDHDHKTGEIRGLLCRRCNMALGLLDESPAIVKSLHRYLLIGNIKTPAGLAGTLGVNQKLLGADVSWEK